MSGAEIAQILVAAATFITALGGVVIGIMNSRRIEVVKIATDGMKDALVAATSEAAERKGAERGREEQTAERQAERGLPPRPTQTIGG